MIVFHGFSYSENQHHYIQSAYAILSNGLLQRVQCGMPVDNGYKCLSCTTNSMHLLFMVCFFIGCVFFSSWEILGSVELYFQQKITCSSEVVSYT